MSRCRSAAPSASTWSDERAQDAYDDVPLRFGLDELPHLLGESAVVCARYGLDGHERTLRKLGSGLGVSAERVRQIEPSALEKMRAAASAPLGAVLAAA
jgi:DNA-directed RNA polymerase sigma subunit (sigma70/sigma32)